MGQLQSAYQGALNTYNQGQQDAFIQHWQHADAQPQSTGSTGSSSGFFQQTFVQPPISENGSTVAFTNLGGGSNPNGNSGGASGNGEPQYTNPASWQYDVSGNWNDPSLWSDGLAPVSWQTLLIEPSVLITVTVSDLESASGLGLGPFAILDVIGGGSLTVADAGATNAVDVYGLLEVTDPSPATLTIEGQVRVEVTGEIESIGSLATIYFLTDPLSATPNNFINNFGVIAANDYSNVYFEQATVTNDAIHGLIAAGDYGTVTFDQGSVVNGFLIETVDYGGVGYGTIVFNGTSIDNFGTIDADYYGTVSFELGTTLTNEIGSEVVAENYGTLVLEAGNTITSQDHGLFEAIGGGEIDVKDSGIFNIGANPLAALDPSGILLGSGGTLLVDVAELTLDGSGALVLEGGTIAGQAANAADTLDNLNNVISGFGLISNLTLLNGGTVDATGGILTVDSSIVTNTNLFEASGGTLVLSNTSLDNSDHHNGDPIGTITVTASRMLYLRAPPSATVR